MAIAAIFTKALQLFVVATAAMAAFVCLARQREDKPTSPQHSSAKPSTATMLVSPLTISPSFSIAEFDLRPRAFTDGAVVHAIHDGGQHIQFDG